MRAGAAFAGALYIAAAMIVLFAGDRRGAHWLWRWIGALLALLGIARGFDVSFRLAAMLRNYAEARGMYELRRPWQGDAMHWLAMLVLAVLIGVIMMRRTAPVILRVATIAVTGLSAIAVVRLVSLHEADHWMSADGVLGLSRIRVAELALLATCAAAAAVQVRRSRNCG